MCSLKSIVLLAILAFQVYAHVSLVTELTAEQRLKNFQAAVVSLCGSQEDGEVSKPQDCIRPLLLEEFDFGSRKHKWGKERFLKALRDNEIANFTRVLVKNVLSAKLDGILLHIEIGKPPLAGQSVSFIYLYGDSKVPGGEAISVFDMRENY